MTDPERGRRFILAGAALVGAGAAGAFLPRFLAWREAESSAQDGPPLPPGSVRRRASDVAWGERDWLLVLSSVGCPYCARWEAEELPSFLRSGRALLLRDWPRDDASLRAASFLRGFSDPGARMQVRPLLHRDLRGTLRRAAEGDFGVAGEAAYARWQDPDSISEVLSDAEADRTLFRVRGTPTFARDGFRPLLGYATADMLARMLPAA